MEKSLSDNTIKQYNTTLKLWWDFCNRFSISPFEPQISQVLTFFQELLESTTNVFGSFNTHRSALSLITSVNLGEDLHIKRFMKGIFRLRPPKPRYDCTWEPQQVLKFLQKTDISNLKQLSYKLVTLLALATGQRVQTLGLIMRENIHFSDSGVKILVPDPIKTSKPKSFQPCLNLPYLRENPQLCVASTLKKYLDETADLRQSNDNLFITFKKPHRPASKQSLSRWIKDTLSAAGIDTTIFTAHSTRHSSTSKAQRKGLSLDVIRNSAGWSKNSETFARFYNRPLSETGSFLNSVFDTI